MSVQDEAKRLLEQGRIGMQPPSGARERVLAAVIATPSIPPPTGPASPAGSAGAAAAGGSALGAKAALLIGALLVLVAAVVAAIHFATRRAAVTRASAPAEPSASVAAVVDPTVVAPPASSVLPPIPARASHSARPLAPPAHASATSPARDSLLEELRLLRDAQSALRAGNAGRALTLLDEHAARYPRSAFTQERLATRIQALCRLGRTSEAASLFARLKSSSPSSPHVAALRRSCPALDTDR